MANFQIKVNNIEQQKPEPADIGVDNITQKQLQRKALYCKLKKEVLQHENRQGCNVNISPYSLREHFQDC